MARLHTSNYVPPQIPLSATQSAVPSGRSGAASGPRAPSKACTAARPSRHPGWGVVATTTCVLRTFVHATVLPYNRLMCRRRRGVGAQHEVGIPIFVLQISVNIPSRSLPPSRPLHSPRFGPVTEVHQHGARGGGPNGTPSPMTHTSPLSILRSLDTPSLLLACGLGLFKWMSRCA